MASPTQVMNKDQIFKHTHDVAASVLPSEALLTVSSMSFHSENKQDQEYHQRRTTKGLSETLDLTTS